MKFCISPANSEEITLIQVGLQQAIALFNQGRFFDAHEALEDLWRDAPKHTPARRHLQGLTQLAVAFHHHSKGNYVGALSVLKRGLRNLEGANESLPTLDTSRLKIQLERWQEFLEDRVMPHTGEGLHNDKEQPRVQIPRPPQMSLRR